ncbi:DUF6527 family protein [Spirosoma sp.]|uniref:DUF6527 family protein n=1 Tax=Spirosoma sp. TaxID=1899569 RepID=UPI003B3AFFE2
MMIKALRHNFVKFIPEKLDEGVLYVSIDYCTAAHNCACGCGNKVITPITPTDWELMFNGDAISLSPSIGNWSFDCQSHYWIKGGEIQWAGRWSQDEIEEGRRKDQIRKRIHFSKADDVLEASTENEIESVEQEPVRGFWQRLFQKIGL